MKNDLSMPALAWILLTVTCLVLILIGLSAGLQRTGWHTGRRKKVFSVIAVIICIWMTLLLILSYHGFFSDFSKLPPRPALAVLVPLPFIAWFAFSKTGTQLLRSIPVHWMIFLQSFRIIVELLLLKAFLDRRLPVQMTFEGRNFDIAAGLLALPVGYLLLVKKTYAGKLAIVFNFIGMLLLMNILIVAVLSMPTPYRYFMNEPANTLVAEFPFILLPGVLVPIAYGLHIFSFRQLLVTKSRQNEQLIHKNLQTQ